VGDLYPFGCNYPPIILLRYSSASSIYNITWRGLTALLILTWGQCEGLNLGMSEKYISHAFFVSIRFVEFDDWYGRASQTKRVL